MGDRGEPRWLSWAKRLQAIAQTGLTYSEDPFDVERYRAVREIAAEMIAPSTSLDAAHVVDVLGRDTGHATPKVDVRGVVIRRDAVLLVKERQDGLWTLPGGWADVGESPAESVTREVLEESGYRTRATRLLAVYDRDRHGHTPLAYYVYKLFFMCELVDETPVTRPHGGGAAYEEIDEVAFYPEDALPDLSLGRVTPAQIARFFDHHRNPDWPTDFD